MATSQNRVHYYHADVSALGGHIETPIRQQIPVAAPLSLPPVGGYAGAHADRYRLESVLGFESARTQVAGSVSHKNGAWTTLATAVVDGLNILDVITADRIVTQMATEHPVAGYIPTVTFVGTKFENLRISGYPVTPVIDLNLCGQNLEAGQSPKRALIQDDAFLKGAAEQYRKMGDDKSLPGWVKNRTIPPWVRERYTWDNGQLEQRSALLCSLVTQVQGEFPGRPFGHVLEIPEIGRIFLGELLVDHNTYRLIGLRAELGCAVHGAFSASNIAIEGNTWP